MAVFCLYSCDFSKSRELPGDCSSAARRHCTDALRKHLNALANSESRTYSVAAAP